MEYVAVLVAAAGAFVFGAVWYGINAKTWMEAAGVKTGADGKPEGASNPVPYIISAISLVLVAGMMRHMFSLSGIDSAGKGLLAGLGLGIFIATPWIVTNYAYAGRSRPLMMIDGGFATIGCTIIGTILALF